MRMYWRVFGPAWQRPEIDYQFGLLKDAGVGGVMVFFFYPVAIEGNGVHNQKFLSDEFLDTLGYAARKAHEMGLRFSLAGGTGWPYGSPSVGIEDVAQQIRRVEVPLAAGKSQVLLPRLKAGERILAAFCGTNDVTVQLTETGWKPGTDSGSNPSAPFDLYITGPAGMQVKRPALGAEGLVVSHYDRAPAQRYLDAVVAPMLRAAPGLVESIFCDSLEVYRSNWTPDLPAVFKRDRGYDLIGVLPDLFDNGSPKSKQVRFDFWRTLAKTTESQFTKELYDWAHAHHVRFEMEAYGTPPNPLTAARYIDVPTGEQYEWRGFSLSRLAASGAHLAGRRIIGAEAWTWLGLPNRLADSLSDAKLASDLHFLAGENDLTGVDFAYSPRWAGAPGWMPYYGPVWNQNNPQWPWFKYLADYAARCQWLLRQGKPVADVALYLPVEDIFAGGPVDQMLLGFHLRDHFVSGQKTTEFNLQTALRHRSDVIQAIFDAGQNFDGMDFFAMNRLARVAGRTLVAGDGCYQVLVLPRMKGIELQALEKIVSFCKAGGKVIATGRLPETVYGAHTVSSQKRGAQLLYDLFGNAPGTDRRWVRDLAKGSVLFFPDESMDLTTALVRACRPQVFFDPAQPDVGFVHRRTADHDIYFLCNTGENAVSCRATFFTDWNEAQLWNPMSGSISGLVHQRLEEELSQVELNLASRGSVFVVFGKHPAQSAPKTGPTRMEQLQTEWTLKFEGSNAPATQIVTDLRSWTDLPGGRYFSGRCDYSASIAWNHPPPRQAWLVLPEEVREAAEVRINGHDAGPVWMPPHEVEISRWLMPGTNSLSITVANLPLNLFLGLPDQDLSALRAAYGDRFPAPQEKKVTREPAPSGLIGPVHIRFVP